MDLILYALVLVSIGVLIALWFTWSGRRKTGLVLGFLPVALAWLSVVGWIYLSCLSCAPNTLCCENSGIGMFVVTSVAIVAELLYVGVTIGLMLIQGAFTTRARTTSEPSEKRVRLLWRVTWLLAVPVAFGVAGSIMARLTADGTLVSWKRIETAAWDEARLNGSSLHSIATSGMCDYRFVITSPPRAVKESVDRVYCTYPVRHETHYVELVDDSHWLWEHESESFINGIMAVLMPLFGSLVGFIGAAFALHRFRVKGAATA